MSSYRRVVWEQTHLSEYVVTVTKLEYYVMGILKKKKKKKLFCTFKTLVLELYIQSCKRTPESLFHTLKSLH